MRSYYGRPVLKEPVWTWEIPAYFFTGGIGGVSAGLGLAARIAGNEPLARTSTYVSAAADAVSPLLLVSDLGRPERFLNMLRVFKVTSPMSIGSWLLFVSAGASGDGGRAGEARPAEEARAGGRDRLRRHRRAARHVHRRARGEHCRAGLARCPSRAPVCLRRERRCQCRRGLLSLPRPRRLRTRPAPGRRGRRGGAGPRAGDGAPTREARLRAVPAGKRPGS